MRLPLSLSAQLLRILRFVPKKGLLHLLDQKRPCVAHDGSEPVLVDEHGLVESYPLLPGFLGYVRIDALHHIAGVRGWTIEAGPRASGKHN